MSAKSIISLGLKAEFPAGTNFGYSMIEPGAILSAWIFYSSCLPYFVRLHDLR
jgi:hypothetical protein